MRWRPIVATATLLLVTVSAEASTLENAIYHPAPKRSVYEIRPARIHRLATYIQRKRQVSPERALAFAEALYPSRWAYTLAAIGAAEGTFNPQEPRGPAGEEGAFRIIPRIWGPVPHSIEGQVRQAERVLETLITQYGYREAVKRYNGAGQKAAQYAEWVLGQTRRI